MPDTKLFRLSASVYARREGKILVLMRSGGAMSGQWWLPGGTVDDGEGPAEAAARELFEESGLRPSGPLRLISAYPMHIYDVDSVQLSYACDVPDGEVALNPDEHSEHAWLSAREYRDRDFGDQRLVLAESASPAIAGVFRACRQSLDDYLAFEDHEFEDTQLRSDAGILTS